MPNIRREIIEDGIFLLTFDRPDSTANFFDFETLSEFESHLDAIASPEHKARGLIIVSAKPAVFIAGADLHALRKMNTEEVKTFIQRGQTVFNKLDALPFPTVAAMHGAALGGGYELALACDWRLASPDASTQIGLPETKFGIIPAWGGCTRLPRLLSVSQALDVILGGQVLPARQALSAGLIDEVVPKEHLQIAARRFLERGKYQHSVAHSAPVNALVDAVLAPKARHEVQQRTHGNFPAVEKALEVVLKGSASWDEADSLEREREAIAELIGSDVTRQLLGLHFAKERAKKLTFPLSADGAAPAADGPLGITRTAVLGAGVMGSGIAQWISARGFPVILRDTDPARLAQGMGSIAGLYASAVRQRTLADREARAGRDLVSPAATEVPLRFVDLVVEATTENLDAKKSVLQRLDDLVREDTILATNTSALSVGTLAAATRHPRRVIGLHFFNPVHKMPLVEVIVGKDTAPEVAQRTLRFAQRLGKLPILVQDSPGFLVNRILIPYLAEAGALFWNGAEVKDIDAAMRDFGLPMGPLRLIDEIGADVVLEISATLAAAFPTRLRIPEVLLPLQGMSLLGRKTAKGFYKYRNGSEASVNKEVGKLRPPGQRSTLTRDDLEQRLVLLIINEAARCLEERIAATASDIDLAMVLGTGFAPFRGGPLRYADSIAVTRVVEDLTRLTATGGPHYAPCALLQEMAKTGQRFYQD